MAQQASNLWKRLGRSLAANPRRFTGGSAWIEPFDLLAIDRERAAALQHPRSPAGPAATSALAISKSASTS